MKALLFLIAVTFFGATSLFAQTDIDYHKRPILSIPEPTRSTIVVDADANSLYMRETIVREEETRDTSYRIVTPAKWNVSFIPNPDNLEETIIYVNDPALPPRVFEMEEMDSTNHYCICRSAFLSHAEIDPFSPPPAGMRILTNVPTGEAHFFRDEQESLTIQFIQRL